MSPRPPEMKTPPVPIPPSLNEENTALYLKLLLKQQELEHVKVMSESKERIMDKQREIALAMRDTILDYAKASSANKYSPMAVSHIASTFAAMSNGDSPPSNIIDLSGFEDPAAEGKSQVVISPIADIPERVKIAQEQGFRWNDHDVMPANPTLAEKKIREWEEQIALGRASEVSHKPYNRLLKDTSKAFIIGLCLSLEGALGFDKPVSPYLKKRYEKLQALALKEQGLKIVNTAEKETVNDDKTPLQTCSLPPDEIIEGIYQTLYGGLSIDVHHDKVTSVWKRIVQDEYGGDFRKIPGYTLAKSATLGGIPTSIEWESEEERERTIYRRRFTAEQREKYADQLRALLDKYLDSIGY